MTTSEPQVKVGGQGSYHRTSPAPSSNPHSARCTTGAQRPATSCLGAFRPPAAAIRGQAVIPAAENLHRLGRSASRFC